MTNKYEPKQKALHVTGRPMILQGTFAGLNRVDYGENKSEEMYFLLLEDCSGLPKDNAGRSQVTIHSEVCRFVDENFVAGDALQLPITVSARIDKNNRAALSVNHVKTIAMPQKLNK